ncbi:glycosyltransferase [Methylomicrobium sp. Wu6]|uniref:glycosyltransferase family 2 protein n=1 Tax=Methylomicrobium sp. Wu6 TaxID=3107928 RepID=UPI002DD6566E|nr:glycosyltransferase [Methylomicrobium sp. Wu6]MEC4749583.1 glycosyltransferase [Methylomicrobium sp. Wu6]
MHITVCICTFKRPEFLKGLLDKLSCQLTEGLFSFSLVIVDNDRNGTAYPIVEVFDKISKIQAKYFVEAEQNISLARNRAIENADGDLVAFIDDDELPPENWLLVLFKAYMRFQVDGILAPVLPYYETPPPNWIVKGRFHERPSHETGTVLTWKQTRTGNALLRRDLFREEGNLFRVEFGSGGEDRDLFRRLIDQGHKFVWCAEAPVYEIVPPERHKRWFMLRRALLRGKTPYNHNYLSYAKSLIAIPLYTILLPFLLLVQHHLFMKYLVSYFDHIGRVISFLGLDVIKDKYITK